MDRGWNPWQLTTLGLAIVMATALVTGLVVANWSGWSPESEPRLSARPGPLPRSAAVKPPQPIPQGAPESGAVPTREAIEACNRQASAEVGEHKTQEVVKDAAIGAVVGAAGGAVAGSGKGAGKGAAIGGTVGAGGGTLYGLNENREHDEKYRAAYSSCMRARGYTAG
jgi:uncharacterized protein YcfJ